MSMSIAYHFVKIHYGPTYSFYTMAHRPQKLQGMKDQLIREGYRVELNPVQHLNLCMLEMCGFEVFRCNQRYLGFNMSVEMDEVCASAVAAVLFATERLVLGNINLWSREQIESQIFKHKDYGPRPTSPFDVDFRPLKLVCDCNESVDEKEERAEYSLNLKNIYSFEKV